MDVKIENVKSNIIEAGDITWYKNSKFPTIITEHTVNGIKGLNGISLDGHFWCDDPDKLVKNGDAILYKKDEWELVLRRK